MLKASTDKAVRSLLNILYNQGLAQKADVYKVRQDYDPDAGQPVENRVDIGKAIVVLSPVTQSEVVATHLEDCTIKALLHNATVPCEDLKTGTYFDINGDIYEVKAITSANQVCTEVALQPAS
jgi:hypothetical protein